MISPTLTWIVGAFKKKKGFKQVPPYPHSQAFTSIERTTETYRLNSNGLIEELAIDVPRQDWDINKGKVSDYPCISLRQNAFNYILRTEKFDKNDWVKFGGAVTSNKHTAPDGSQNADVFEVNGSVHSLKYIEQDVDIKVNNTKAYFSVWVRDGGGVVGNPGTGFFTLSIWDNVNSNDLTYVTYDIINGVVVDSDGNGPKPENIMIKEYLNKWFRVGFMCDVPNGSSGDYKMRLYAAVNNPQTASFPTYLQATNIGQQIQYWGANNTKTQYALPYIHSDSAFEEVGEDVFYSDSLTDYINSPTGLWFIHVKMASLENFLKNSSANISLSSGNTNDSITFNFKSSNPNFSMNINVDGISQAFFQGDLDFSNEIKLAVYYKQNYVELFYNGKSIYTDSTFDTFASMVLNKITNDDGGGSDKFEEGDIYQYRFYDVRTLQGAKIKQLQKQLTQ